MSLTSDASSPRSYVSPRISTPQTNTVPIKPLISTPPVSSQPKVSLTSGKTSLMHPHHMCYFYTLIVFSYWLRFVTWRKSGIKKDKIIVLIFVEFFNFLKDITCFPVAFLPYFYFRNESISVLRA
uniref:Uncharacterized protein n=1 Tax=Canis lupus familiaris TaxID=9615 RepID=A0A8C0N3I2_CANLF